MRSLDTNVLVRYLMADDPRQCAAAERVLEQCHENQEQVFLSIPVLCETVWVLTRGYRESKPVVIEILKQILDKDLFQVEDHAAVRRSLQAYRDGKADFVDYLIGEVSGAAGCRDTVTFDRDLRGAPGFTVLA